MKKLLLLMMILLVSVAIVAAFSVGGCKPAEPVVEEPVVEEPVEEPVEVAPVEEVTIKFLGNLPDRAAAQGVLEQLLIDNYLSENPNVTIEQEQLQDEPYHTKFAAYTSSVSLPDIFMVWGFPSFFRPVMEEGYAAELNPSDYDNYDFFQGSLDGFSYNGKLYGLPRNTDYMFLFYNKSIFDENGVKVPTTYEEFVDAVIAFRAKGITPIAMNGMDKWAIAIMFQDIILKVNGDQKAVYNALDGITSFSEDEGIKEGVQVIKELMDTNPFQDAFTAADYGAAKNLFTQGGAAMYYMGEWEMGMAVDENLSESFRNNVHAIAFPAFKDAKEGGKATDLMSWNGGGYAVSADSEVKDEAIKLLNYIFKPENWAKNSWQMGVNIPAQKFDSFFTGEETALQEEVSQILNNATSISGTTLIDASSAAFKEESQVLAQSFAAGIITPEEYLAGLDAAAAAER